MKRNKPKLTLNVANSNHHKNDPLVEHSRAMWRMSDLTVSLLLEKAFSALEPGGSVVISEPMSGFKSPSRSGDAYFGFYTLAMTSGKPRNKWQHFEFLRAARFEAMKSLSSASNFVTSVIVAKKPPK